MGKSLIIFDMDGTLIDSSRLLANAINFVRGKLGLAPMPHDAIVGHVNNNQLNPAKYFYDVDRFEPIHEQWFSTYYTVHHDQELALYEGIPELLSWLRRRGTTVALATNARRNSTLESLRHLAIEEAFDAVICQDDVEHPKPAPDMLHALLDGLGHTREAALFIGDGPRDEESAQTAGIDYIMVDWGFTEHHPDKKVVQSVAELKKILERETGE